MKDSHFQGLRTVIYGVNDIDKAKKWYTEILQIQPYFDQPFYVGFTVGGFELGLDPYKKTIGNKHEGVIAYWGVEDIEKEYQRLLSLGAIEHEKVQVVGDEIKVATVLDPFGNIFGLIYNPHFGKPSS